MLGLNNRPPKNKYFQITYFYNPAVVAEWLEQQLCNLQRQQSCSDPDLNPARFYDIDCSKCNKLQKLVKRV